MSLETHSNTFFRGIVWPFSYATTDAVLMPMDLAEAAWDNFRSVRNSLIVADISTVASSHSDISDYSTVLPICTHVFYSSHEREKMLSIMAPMSRPPAKNNW